MDHPCDRCPVGCGLQACRRVVCAAQTPAGLAAYLILLLVLAALAISTICDRMVL